jgi:hypothetical protein
LHGTGPVFCLSVPSSFSFSGEDSQSLRGSDYVKYGFWWPMASAGFLSPSKLDIRSTTPLPNIHCRAQLPSGRVFGDTLRNHVVEP